MQPASHTVTADFLGPHSPQVQSVQSWVGAHHHRLPGPIWAGDGFRFKARPGRKRLPPLQPGQPALLLRSPFPAPRALTPPSLRPSPHPCSTKGLPSPSAPPASVARISLLLKHRQLCPSLAEKCTLPNTHLFTLPGLHTRRERSVRGNW